MPDLSRATLFTATTRPEEALAFYRDTLGLRLVEDTPFALVFTVGSQQLRVQKAHAPFEPLPFTQLGWEVDDIELAARELMDRGVQFERYPHMEQDDLGIWSVGDARVCWFRDPDGNTLSLSQGA